MIIGYDLYGNSNAMVFQTINPIGSIYRIELTDSIIDEVEVRKRTDLIYSSTKEEWTYDTLLLAKFQNNLEAGNISLGGMLVEKIMLKKRRVEDLVWQDLISYTIQDGVNVYQFVDRLVEAGTEYEYAILPIGEGNFEGQYNVDRIVAEFEGTYICDKDNIFRLLYNLEYGDIENIISSSVIETFAQYPVVSYGNLDYRQGSIQCLLLSDVTVDSGDIDLAQEKMLRKQVMQFLKNKKPKILKDNSGNYLMIAIIGSPKEIPNNDLAQQIYNISFDWVEIGNPYTDF